MNLIIKSICLLMRKKITFSLIIFTGLNFAQSGADECSKAKINRFNRLQKFANVNYPGDSTYDVKYYKLDLAVDEVAHTISGNVTCNAKIVQNSINQIYYDFTSALFVDSVLLNSTSTTFSRGTNTLVVNIESTYNSGDHFSTIVYYHGTPSSTGFGSFTFGTTFNGEPSVYTLSEPYGAKDWWPVKDTPADKADSADMWITVSNNLIPASNGTLMGIVNNGNGTHTYKWKSSYPIAHYLLSMAIADYVEYTNYYYNTVNDSMPINNFIYPESFTFAKPFLDKTPGMIEVYAERFGEYPFINEKYGHAQFGWGGMEHQTISSIDWFNDMLIAHELAHMWFGDMITCKDWHHIWLNEGFANYANYLMNEAWYGKSGYDNSVANEVNNAKNAVGSIWVQDISNFMEIFDVNREYNKGAIVLHMLRGIVGDSTFFNILKSYVASPNVAYGVATTEDFQAVAESVSGMDLDYFFQQWIYGESYPIYSVIWSKQGLGGNSYDLVIKIIQNLRANPSYFTMPIQVKVNFASGDTTITIFNNAQVQNFNVTISGEPTSISFDPENWILKTVNSVVNGVDGDNIVDKYALEQNFPNPFNTNTKVNWQSPVSGHQTLKVYDVLGNEIITLVNEFRNAGSYETDFDARRLSSGVYFYKLQAGDFVQTKKMILIK